MLDTLSTPIADSPLASSLHSAGSALGRTAAGFVFVGVLVATSELLGPAGFPVASAVAMLAIGSKFFTLARRRHDG